MSRGISAGQHEILLIAGRLITEARERSQDPRIWHRFCVFDVLGKKHGIDAPYRDITGLGRWGGSPRREHFQVVTDSELRSMQRALQGLVRRGHLVGDAEWRPVQFTTRREAERWADANSVPVERAVRNVPRGAGRP